MIEPEYLPGIDVMIPDHYYTIPEALPFLKAGTFSSFKITSHACLDILRQIEQLSDYTGYFVYLASNPNSSTIYTLMLVITDD